MRWSNCNSLLLSSSRRSSILPVTVYIHSISENTFPSLSITCSSPSFVILAPELLDLVNRVAHIDSSPRYSFVVEVNQGMASWFRDHKSYMWRYPESPLR